MTDFTGWHKTLDNFLHWFVAIFIAVGTLAVLIGTVLYILNKLGYKGPKQYMDDGVDVLDQKKKE